MKQKKVKKELVLATYPDYVKHFGIKLGAKKWKERKKLTPLKKVILKGPTAEVKEVRVEEIPVEKMPEKDAKEELKYRGDKMMGLLQSAGWRRFLKPEIENIIVTYKEQYDKVNSIEELKVNQKIREILLAVLDYPKDCIEDAKAIREQEEEEKE